MIVIQRYIKYKTFFQVEQQKAYEKNKAWMNQSNQEYIIARLKKLPAVWTVKKKECTTLVLH